MAQVNENLKIAAIGVLLVAALAMAYYFTVLQKPGPIAPPELALGSEINLQTFATILTGSNSIYLIMDVRNATDAATKHGILSCGVDFAGSLGLGNKNLTIYSLDAGENCIDEKGNYTSAACLERASKGISILIRPGNSTSFYTNAMVVGLGKNYTAGSCYIR